MIKFAKQMIVKKERLTLKGLFLSLKLGNDYYLYHYIKKR